MISAVSGAASCVVTDTSNDIIIGGWGVDQFIESTLYSILGWSETKLFVLNEVA